MRLSCGLIHCAGKSDLSLIAQSTQVRDLEEPSHRRFFSLAAWAGGFFLAPLGANPTFGPAEQGGMLEMSELNRFPAIGIDSDTFEKFGFLTLENQSFRPQNSKNQSSGN